MGITSSSQNQHLEKYLGNDFPQGEYLIGFENPSNICYSNVIIQTLFYCKQFRHGVLNYEKVGSGDNLLSLAKLLFSTITNQKNKTGVVSTKKIMSFVKQKNRIFDGHYHQDCHEFYMWFINECEELLMGLNKKQIENHKQQKNFVHQIFQGSQVTRTICMKCNTQSERSETFYNLSLDLNQNCSLGYCISRLSQVELLRGQDQFYCDNCQCKQDATKTLLLSELPQTLVIHLKRFKYEERSRSMMKITSKIPFPLEIKVNTNHQEVKSKYYELSSIIVHMGQGIQYGHYICLIKIENKWYKFDDEKITLYPELDIFMVYGRNMGAPNQSCAYMLFYNEKYNN